MEHADSRACSMPVMLWGPPYSHCLGKVDAVRREPKEIKSKKRTTLETINTLYSISYNQIQQVNFDKVSKSRIFFLFVCWGGG